MRMVKGEPFTDVRADGEDVPVFSWDFLIEKIGKGDTRFVLSVAEEYAHVIEALGPDAVRVILDAKPRLARRLGIAEAVRECLDDALSPEAERYLEEFPAEVTVGRRDLMEAWELLHDGYRRYYEPEKSMGADKLDAYGRLTVALGMESRREEVDRARPAAIERRDALLEFARERVEAEREMIKAARLREQTPEILERYAAACEAYNAAVDQVHAAQAEGFV